MEIRDTALPGAKLIVPRLFPDARGFFVETYRASMLSAHSIDADWVQDNHSRSARGVVRGLHFQVGSGCAKLVRCGRGTIWDVIVDLRLGSPTYRRWQAFELSDENMHALYIPIGFAHGFCVLSEIADVLYKQSSYYSTEVERGIAYDDPDIDVRWPLQANEIVVSGRDAAGPPLAAIADTLPFKFKP